jgi:hypothetical protein
MLANQKLNDLQKEFDLCEAETIQLRNRCQQSQKDASTASEEALTLKENIGASLAKNNDSTAKLRALETVLK